MYPTKSVFEYRTEMNRVYPKNGDGDIFSPHTMAPSSSSTDTSPDSFPDLTALRFTEYQNRRPDEAPFPRVVHRPVHVGQEYGNQFRSNNFRPDFESLRPDAFESMKFESQQQTERYRPEINEIYNTPLPVKRERPIMGRKIMAEAPLSISKFPVWQPDLTPPKENKYTSYELFPSENRGFDFPSPVKTSPTQTSPKSQFGTSPRSPFGTSPSLRSQFGTSPRTQFAPQAQFGSQFPSPRTPNATITPPKIAFKEPMMGPYITQNNGTEKMCTFCRKNGETPLVYLTHTVKEKVGHKTVVTCPILRSHVCSTCGVSGDNAHTITYCPVLRSGNNGQPLQSTTITLKNTRVKSNGRRRY